LIPGGAPAGYWAGQGALTGVAEADALGANVWFDCENLLAEEIALLGNSSSQVPQEVCVPV